jgi:hypothetical protein
MSESGATLTLSLLDESVEEKLEPCCQKLGAKFRRAAGVTRTMASCELQKWKKASAPTQAK